MKVLITGADGFIGKNLGLHLAERRDVEVLSFTLQNNTADLPLLMQQVDFVFHLAGVNRPLDQSDFKVGNVQLTQAVCEAACAVAETTGKKIPILLTSSIHATNDTAYGQSKRGAEEALHAATASHQLPTHIFRLPNVFGKWCLPNYNSVVATFCYNIAHNLPIQINDPAAVVNLVYVDDVVEHFIRLMDGAEETIDEQGFATVTPQYSSTVGELAGLIRSFRDSRETLVTERVGTGLVRALYSTYVSYLPKERFAYTVVQHRDPRGVFTEMLKTPDCGQFSFFTAHPGITRGGHYHHSKTEKFLVIKGRACFKFRHMYTGETYELVTSGEKAQIVETIPGWTHDITNISNEEMIVMLWANETFDRARPDTFSCPL